MYKKRRFLDDDGEDPTSGIINMTDCMLVLAVGFLVFAILALQSNPTLITSSTQGPTQDTVTVSTGETLNKTLDNQSGSGNSYQQMGTVYKDPETGKLVLVS
ncbi:DUF2149 domain-containing protein [Methanobacterium formicicum]|uniref:DUF2149 domain-containing protein n=1 Tax=Methanobacterium formicicum TaxID=2162 RepID=A0A0S4FPA5_METFO|nr:DUF2149 domain-containing protein [Methanobacterium formicicum]CEL24910.1 hypothetical protein MB9_1272 [Methanobacterium formicicum]